MFRLGQATSCKSLHWTDEEIRCSFAKAAHSITVPALNFCEKSFQDDTFRLFCQLLGERKQMVVQLSESYLTQEQIDFILKLINSNENKGITLQDEEGNPFGPVYTDWSSYNRAKKYSTSFGMHDTTSTAISLMDAPPRNIIDYGAGTGQDTIPLLAYGWKVTAIEANKEAIGILMEMIDKKISEGKIGEEDKKNLTCFQGPFINFDPGDGEKADFFNCSFTWPYRPPEEFPATWEKTKRLVKARGIIAGHFFGPSKLPDPAMTYHTELQLRALLILDFQVLWFRKELHGEGRQIYGGKGENQPPPWGELYNVVARKRR